MNINSPILIEESTNWSEYLRYYEDCSLTNELKEEESSNCLITRQYHPVTPSGYTPLNLTRLERFLPGSTPLDETRPDKQLYGGFINMSLILSDLFDQGRLPKQIYEICVPEGEYKKFLMRNLPRGYDRTAVLSDRYFNDLLALIARFELLPRPLDLLLIDIGELSYIESIKNYDGMVAHLKHLYECIEALAKLGTTCIIFVNFVFHNQISEIIARPETIQIDVHPSDFPPLWEALITSPPELHGRKSLFDLFHDEVPLLHRF